MSYQVDRTAQLAEAVKKSRFGSVASLQSKIEQTSHQNVAAPAKKAAKKTVSKSTAAKTTAKKTVAKKAAKKS